MELEQFTEKSRNVLQQAQALALRSNHQRFTPEHILTALLDEPSITKLLDAAKANARLIGDRSREALVKLPAV